MRKFSSDRELRINQQVKVYRNIRKDSFSVLDKKTCRLITHKDILVLSNVEFKVNKAGQEKVRQKKQKNVHAYVIGKYVGNVINKLENYQLIYYNPYTTNTFIRLDNNSPVLKAKRCYLIGGKCYIEK